MWPLHCTTGELVGHHGVPVCLVDRNLQAINAAGLTASRA